MPESWEGVLMLLAVTAITVLADYFRRRMPPPSDPINYVPPIYPEISDYVPPVKPSDAPVPDPGGVDDDHEPVPGSGEDREVAE
jgi:hypothetical protein